jgi:hypothetical protein
VLRGSVGQEEKREKQMRGEKKRREERRREERSGEGNGKAPTRGI